MADIFKSMGNIKNGKVTKDGSVLDLEGNTISGPNEDLAIFYRTLAPTKNEVLNSDGSTSEIPVGANDYNDVINKPQINNHVLNSGNNTADSLDLQDKLTFDNVPTLNSDNVVKSGGVYAADLAERTARESAISLEKTERETADNVLSQRISAQEGLGGYLPMHDFGVETPTQQELTDYAMANISTATVPADIFNGTRVTNEYDNIVWVLTNTPNTSPALFEWGKAYNNTVNIASNSTLGIVKGSSGMYKVSVNNINGIMTVNRGNKQFSEEDFTTADKSKLDNIEPLAEVNTIENIRLNGSLLTPDSSKTVGITVDKDTVDLGNVDNTSDANKPVSTAQQTAIDNAVLNVAKTNVANTFSAKQTMNGGVQAKNFQTTSYSTGLAGGFGIDTDTKPAFIGLTIIESSFLFITKVEVGMLITLQLIQDNTGGGTVTWSSDFRFPAGVKPVISTAPNVKDIFTFICTEENTLDCVNAVFNLPV